MIRKLIEKNYNTNQLTVGHLDFSSSRSVVESEISCILYIVPQETGDND